MPARFVEVAIPVGSGADALGYVQSMQWNLSAWRDGWLEGIYDWPAAGNASALTGQVSRMASRAALTLANASAPAGPAKWLLCAALALLVVRTLLLRRATRRAVSEYGHAQAE